MHRGVVEFVRPLAQAIVQELQRPHGVILRIDTRGYLADVLGDLGISRQTVDQLGAGSIMWPLQLCGLPPDSAALAGRRC